MHYREPRYLGETGVLLCLHYLISDSSHPVVVRVTFMKGGSPNKNHSSNHSREMKPGFWQKPGFFLFLINLVQYPHRPQRDPLIGLHPFPKIYPRLSSIVIL